MHGTYNYGLVFVSYIVSVLGALTALQLAGAVTSARTQAQSFIRILSAAIAMGGGAIWSMHFIAMVAHQTPMFVTYDTGITLFSAVVAIVASAAGLAIAGLGRFTLARLVGGGLIMGVGVASMHYVGMEAMLMSATIQYDMPIVALSVAIAVVAATAALWLAFNLKGLLQMLASAPIMGVAVCGMHYTGMLHSRRGDPGSRAAGCNERPLPGDQHLSGCWHTARGGLAVLLPLDPGTAGAGEPLMPPV